MTWREGGQKKTLGTVLEGNKFGLWVDRNDEWERPERRNKEMDVPSSLSALSNARMREEYGSVYSILGLGVVAGASIAATALGAGIPLMAVGPLILAVSV